ncbi:hypothetical protein JCM16303_001765 [Sporobolomyces ruberrimus]
MSSQVHASRSHHNLRSHYAPSPPSHDQSTRYATTPEHAHRSQHRQQPSDIPRSLRPVASSSRLPRQVLREEMPPPPLPSQRKHHHLPPPPPPFHSRQNQHGPKTIPYSPPRTSHRLETYDRIPPSSQSTSQRSQRPSPPLSSNPPASQRRQAEPTRDRHGDHQVVLDRMRQQGWHGVGGGGSTASSETMSQRSTSSSSLSSTTASSSRLAKVDSGYAEEEGGEGEDKTAGEKVLEGWSALKKAVAGFAGETAANNNTHSQQGAQIWNRLTTTLAASVGTVQDAWNAEDDGSVGPDGETKLGRAIKT